MQLLVRRERKCLRFSWRAAVPGKFVQGLRGPIVFGQPQLALSRFDWPLCTCHARTPRIEPRKLRLKLKYLNPLDREEIIRSPYSNEPASWPLGKPRPPLSQTNHQMRNSNLTARRQLMFKTSLFQPLRRSLRSIGRVYLYGKWSDSLISPTSLRCLTLLSSWVIHGIRHQGTHVWSAGLTGI